MTAIAEIRELVADGMRQARHGHREVRLQQGPVTTVQFDGRPNRFSFGSGWRAALMNGVACCDSWHSTPEAAAACMEQRLSTSTPSASIRS